MNWIGPCAGSMSFNPSYEQIEFECAGAPVRTPNGKRNVRSARTARYLAGERGTRREARNRCSDRAASKYFFFIRYPPSWTTLHRRHGPGR